MSPTSVPLAVASAAAIAQASSVKYRGECTEDLCIDLSCWWLKRADKRYCQQAVQAEKEEDP